MIKRSNTVTQTISPTTGPSLTELQGTPLPEEYYSLSGPLLYTMTNDDRVRQLCEAREEGEKTQRTLEILRQQQLQQVKEQEELLQNQRTEIQNQRTEIQNQRTEIQNQRVQIHNQQNEIKEKDEEIARLRALLNETNN